MEQCLAKAITASHPPKNISQGNGPSRWCICYKCYPIPKRKKCCRQRDCVTSNPAFDNLVLNRDTLDIAIVHSMDVLLAHQTIPQQRQYIIWKYGHLGGRNQRVVPSCVTWAIRDKYLTLYMGYHDY